MPCMAPCHLPSTADALMRRGHGSSWHVLGSCSARGEDAVVDHTNGALDSGVWVMDAQHLLRRGEDRMRGRRRGPS